MAGVTPGRDAGLLLAGTAVQLCHMADHPAAPGSGGSSLGALPGDSVPNRQDYLRIHGPAGHPDEFRVDSYAVFLLLYDCQSYAADSCVCFMLLACCTYTQLLSEKSPVRDFKGWLIDCVKGGVEFPVLLLALARFDVLFSMGAKIDSLRWVTGERPDLFY